MEIFFSSLVAGLAAAFVIRLLETLFENLLPVRFIRILGTVPLAGLGCWVLGVTDYSQLAVAAFASSFVALTANMLTQRPAVEAVIPRRRTI
jgi:hypothetical protein